MVSGRKSAVVISFLVALFAAAGATRAGGFSIPDFGIRRIGMFAVVGYPDDPTAIFHNPAGLVLNDGTLLYHAESWFFSELSFRLYDSQGVLRPDHEISPDLSVGAIPFLGAVSDFGTDSFRAGLAVYAPNAYGALLPEDEPTRYHATRALFLASRATLAGAYEFSEKFAIGANVSLIHVYMTATRVFSDLVLADPDKRFLPIEETKDRDSELMIEGQDFTWSADIGFLFRPTPRFRIGAGFASGSAIDLSGEVRLTGPKGQVSSTTHHTEMVIPFTLRGGVNWEFVKDFEIAFDVWMWHYQVLQEQYSRLEDPIAGLTEFRDPRNYGNSIYWCAGMLHRLTPDFELMMGYQQDHTPIPEQTYSLDNPSRDQHGIALGVRWQATPSVKLGLAFVRNWFEMVDIQESVSQPPTNVKGHGANTEVGFDVSWKL